MDKTTVTTPIINKLHEPPGVLETYIRESMQLRRAAYDAGHRNTVKWHKSRLGRQTYCMVTYRRYWVWEYSTWRIYVNNEAGISFEVLPDLSLEDTLQAWSEYLGMMSDDQ